MRVVLCIRQTYLRNSARSQPIKRQGGTSVFASAYSRSIGTVGCVANDTKDRIRVSVHAIGTSPFGSIVLAGTSAQLSCLLQLMTCKQLPIFVCEEERGSLKFGVG